MCSGMAPPSSSGVGSSRTSRTSETEVPSKAVVSLCILYRIDPCSRTCLWISNQLNSSHLFFQDLGYNFKIDGVAYRGLTTLRDKPKWLRTLLFGVLGDDAPKYRFGTPRTSGLKKFPTNFMKMATGKILIKQKWLICCLLVT